MARSSHPGVWLYRRKLKGGTVWYAKWREGGPGGEWHRASLADLPNAQARSDWARAKSAQIASDARERGRRGAVAQFATTVSEALDTWIATNRPRWRAATIESYTATAGLLEQWARDSRIERAEQITPAALARLSDWLAARYREGSPHSTNRRVREARTALQWLRKRGYLPRVSKDELGDSLEYVRAPVEQPQLLTPEHVAHVLRCALAAAPHVEGLVAPAIAWAALTGARRADVCRLRWEWVDLERGEAVLPASATKTHRWRLAEFARVSPGLVDVLRVLEAAWPDATRVFAGEGGDRDVPPATASWWLRVVRQQTVGGVACPRFTWQQLRQTASSWLCTLPRIWPREVAIERAAALLGHTPQVAREHYHGLVRLTREQERARTLDEAWGLGDVLGEIADALRASVNRTV